MVKCDKCGLEFDDFSIYQHIDDECPDRLVACSNDIHGCLWHGKKKLLQNHYETCQFVLELCGQGQCEVYFPKCNMRQHKEEECSGRPFLKKSKSKQVI